MRPTCAGGFKFLADVLPFSTDTAMLKRGSVWYEIDDEEVEEIDEQTVAEAARSAYLLFYSRDH